MPRKRRRGSDFGERLTALRKARGLTQVQLAEAIDSTQRAISYYENVADYPPAPVVAQLAGALRVTADELLGRTSPPRGNGEDVATGDARLSKKFRLLLTLPEKDQRAVLRLVNSLAATRDSGKRKSA